MKRAAISHKLVSTLIFGFAGLILIVTLPGCERSQEPTAIAVKDRLVATEVEKWADAAFGKILDEHRVSALAIAVTQGDDVIFAKGYGYADWAAKTPVSPDSSQFRIASLSKTFAGTAVAQLLERGQIASLDDPVNKYLKRFQLKQAFGKDVTIWDLMTHQGGLGTSPVFVAETENPRPMPPLSGDYIKSKMPEIVREPGTISIYCNPCTATLGFMIEDITGETLQDYFSKNIFLPLGMTHSVNDTDSKPTAQNMVIQYAFAPDGRPVALPYPAIAPYLTYAGSVNSTAGDMAKWLIAHIQEGSGVGPKILSKKSFELMHTRHRGNTPDLSGFGMQFFTYDYNGERVLEHYGSLNFRSMEFLMLDKKIGVFVTFAGGGAPNAEAVAAAASATIPPVTGPLLPAMSHSGVRALILEHFLGPLPIRKDLAVDVAKYAGVYQNIPANPADKPDGAGLKVEASNNGGLVIGGLGVYRPSGPDTFTLDGPLPLEAGFRDSNKFVFATDAAGVARMFAHINAGGYERVPQ